MKIKLTPTEHEKKQHQKKHPGTAVQALQMVGEAAGAFGAELSKLFPVDLDELLADLDDEIEEYQERGELVAEPVEGLRAPSFPGVCINGPHYILAVRKSQEEGDDYTPLIADGSGRLWLSAPVKETRFLNPDTGDLEEKK